MVLAQASQHCPGPCKDAVLGIVPPGQYGQVCIRFDSFHSPPTLPQNSLESPMLLHPRAQVVPCAAVMSTKFALQGFESELLFRKRALCVCFRAQGWRLWQDFLPPQFAPRKTRQKWDICKKRPFPLVMVAARREEGICK